MYIEDPQSEVARVRNRLRNVIVTMSASALVANACLSPVTWAQDLNNQRTTAARAFPPWQNGANNPALNKGLEFTVPEVDNVADFHGSLDDPKLVLYLSGNSFFTMAPLVQAFEARYPQYHGRIYFETLPPGLLAQQMAHGGTITSGNMTWTIKPDVYFAGLGEIKSLIDKGQLKGPAVAYATNDLAIMVAKGNPKHINALSDLSRPDLRLAMPNPAFEGVATQIQASLVKAGGDALREAVYERKVKDGSAMLTQIHHRQTPLYIMQGKVDAGVTWQSEVVFQEQVGNPIAAVAIPADQNTTAIYAGAAINGAAHGQAAADWLTFIVSPESLAIFANYGFKRYDATTATR